jgi:hypothetical protein
MNLENVSLKIWGPACYSIESSVSNSVYNSVEGSVINSVWDSVDIGRQRPIREERVQG